MSYLHSNAIKFNITSLQKKNKTFEAKCLKTCNSVWCGSIVASQGQM